MGDEHSQPTNVAASTTAVTQDISQDGGDGNNDLLNELAFQLESQNPIVQGNSAMVIKEINNNSNNQSGGLQKQGARDRFQARLARKAAALAQTLSPEDLEDMARLEKEAKLERNEIELVCESLDVEVREIAPDGHCLFSSIADQLESLGILSSEESTYSNIRFVAANFILTHSDDFLPFLPSAGGEDGTGALDAGLMTPELFERYCASVRDTAAWGGEPEILALSRAFNVPIHVVQGGKPSIVKHSPQGESVEGDEHAARVVRISYHRRLYGLGEHYNSLRPKRR